MVTVHQIQGGLATAGTSNKERWHASDKRHEHRGSEDGGSNGNGNGSEVGRVEDGQQAQGNETIDRVGYKGHGSVLSGLLSWHTQKFTEKYHIDRPRARKSGPPLVEPIAQPAPGHFCQHLPKVD